MHRRFLWIFEMAADADAAANARDLLMWRHRAPPLRSSRLASFHFPTALLYSETSPIIGRWWLAFQWMASSRAQDALAAASLSQIPPDSNSRGEVGGCHSATTGLVRAQWKGVLDYLWQKGADKVSGTRSDLKYDAGRVARMGLADAIDKWCDDTFEIVIMVFRYGDLSLHSITSICCGFVVQLVVQLVTVHCRCA